MFIIRLGLDLQPDFCSLFNQDFKNFSKNINADETTGLSMKHSKR